MTSELMRGWVSVDVETAGPHPRDHALLAIGACLVIDPDVTFYTELVPDRVRTSAEAMAVHGLSMEHLRATGTPPGQAMADFEAWLGGVVAAGPPRLVAMNAPFDWSFVNDYFWHYLGRNPFGHSAIDIKALAMGRLHSTWEETSMTRLSARFGLSGELTHNALDDARQQALLVGHIMGRGSA